MRVAMFSAKSYERTLLDELNAGPRHELVYLDTLLGPNTASLVEGFPVVSVVVNDVVDRDVLKLLAAGGTKLVATRSTGFNHIDLGAARELGVKVVRVVDYSPNSVDEFAIGLLLALNRKILRAYNRTRQGNFELDEAFQTLPRAARWPTRSPHLYERECQPIGTWWRASRMASVHSGPSGSVVAEVIVSAAHAQRSGTQLWHACCLV